MALSGTLHFEMAYRLKISARCVFRALYKHVLTDIGLESFLKDWKASGQAIL